MQQARVNRRTLGFVGAVALAGRDRARGEPDRNAPREPAPLRVPACTTSGPGRLVEHDGQRRGRQHLLHARVHEPLRPLVHAQRLSRGLGDRPLGSSAGIPRGARQRLARAHRDTLRLGGAPDRDGDASHRRGGELPLVQLRDDDRRRDPGLPAQPEGLEGRAVPLQRLFAHGPGDPEGARGAIAHARCGVAGPRPPAPSGAAAGGAGRGCQRLQGAPDGRDGGRRVPASATRGPGRAAHAPARESRCATNPATETVAGPDVHSHARTTG